jgi:hypothetical protein
MVQQLTHRNERHAEYSLGWISGARAALPAAKLGFYREADSVPRRQIASNGILAFSVRLWVSLFARSPASFITTPHRRVSRVVGKAEENAIGAIFRGAMYVTRRLG